MYQQDCGTNLYGCICNHTARNFSKSKDLCLGFIGSIGGVDSRRRAGEDVTKHLMHERET